MRLVRFIKKLYRRVEITLENNVILTLYMTMLCYMIYIITYENFLISLVGIFLITKLCKAYYLTLNRTRKLNNIRSKTSYAKIAKMAEKSENSEMAEMLEIAEMAEMADRTEKRKKRKRREIRRYIEGNTRGKGNKSKSNIIPFPSKIKRWKN